MSTLAKIFGARLRELREAKGFTQSDLGHQPRIAEYEAGTRVPRFATVEDLAARLRVHPLELFPYWVRNATDAALHVSAPALLAVCRKALPHVQWVSDELGDADAADALGSLREVLALFPDED